MASACSRRARAIWGCAWRVALESALAAGSPGLLIGCDCPVLTPAYLREAAAALAEGNDVVFGPAEDGGYVLIGAARSPLQLFEDIAWGTSTVMQATRARLARGNWRWRELGLLWDLDRPEDLLRWRQLRAAGKKKWAGQPVFTGYPAHAGRGGGEPAKPLLREVPTSGKNSR